MLTRRPLERKRPLAGPFLFGRYRPTEVPPDTVGDTTLEPALPTVPEPEVSPIALLGGPLRRLLPAERPSLGPLLPIVLPFIELPVVVELAA